MKRIQDGIDALAWMGIVLIVVGAWASTLLAVVIGLALLVCAGLAALALQRFKF